MPDQSPVISGSSDIMLTPLLYHRLLQIILNGLHATALAVLQSIPNF